MKSIIKRDARKRSIKMLGFALLLLNLLLLSNENLEMRTGYIQLQEFIIQRVHIYSGAKSPLKTNLLMHIRNPHKAKPLEFRVQWRRPRRKRAVKGI